MIQFVCSLVHVYDLNSLGPEVQRIVAVARRLSTCNLDNLTGAEDAPSPVFLVVIDVIHFLTQ